MARKLRIQYPGVIYHVMNRGDHQEIIFCNDAEGLLNKVEMAFRAYDPCLGCATHSLPGHLPLRVNFYDRERNLVQQLVQS